MTGRSDRLPSGVRAEIETALDTRIDEVDPVSGGDVATASRLLLSDGRTVFAKTKTGAHPEFFPTEAAGLRWLAEPGTVAVPEVLLCSSQVLVLAWIEPGERAPSTESDFGRDLAALHRAGADGFGRVDAMTTGSLRLPNDLCSSWVEFYAANRLAPLARIAADRGALPASTVAELDRLAGRLDQLDVPDEPPARLHGDLWAGNRLVGRGGVNWLIDPAAHGGHREFDLAMMALFGGFGPAAFEAYDAAHRLAPGFADRIPLHQVAPLVVHAVKFGGPYVGASASAIEAALTLG